MLITSRISLIHILQFTDSRKFEKLCKMFFNICPITEGEPIAMALLAAALSFGEEKALQLISIAGDAEIERLQLDPCMTFFFLLQHHFFNFYLFFSLYLSIFLY